eukprot:CAMPEP_0182446730 /NCGR_PEP_ID=MMETSP1172-20130603/5363_1 /TAXON_ID=708627 /ORGANISM="Timspurckia oligopyrenoides, Strain CCMP3278" /LENGTH=328 /DNA_ID=CAMNT_0024642753 /DNA_START=187 /DNA_END=1173 /DNA_ORIENTATION=+
MDVYPYQVGGHGLLQWDVREPNRLFKPVIQKELAFYLSLHSSITPDQIIPLRQFLPKFYGVFQKSIRALSESTVASTMTQIELTQEAPGNANGDPSENVAEWVEQYSKMRYSSSLSLHPTLKSNSEEGVESSPLFIGLFDVNASWSCPCALDVKVGTRHYDDDATEQKRARHISKASASTTAQFGIRLCGMQTFNAELGTTDRIGKLAQRKLDTEGLPVHLRHFFWNGIELRTDVIREILPMLKELRNVLEAQTLLSFYSSSVLIAYEGSIERTKVLKENGQRIASIWMIDFAHTQPRRHAEDNDDGVAFGLLTLISLLEGLLQASED